MSIMKTFTMSVLLIALGVFTLLPSKSFAQAADTLVVAALPPGNLNDVINGDTTATGERNNPNRVYVLQQTGAYDTTYYLTAEVEVKDLTLIGKINPTTGYIPVIAPFILEDNSSIENFFRTAEDGNVTLKNLYITGTRTDGTCESIRPIFARFPNVKTTMENCVIENFGQNATPNLIDYWSSHRAVTKLTHCLWRNNQSSRPQNPGIHWSGPNADDIDTMIVKNCTFAVLGGNIVGSPYSIGYLEFDHNTMFMHTKSSPFSLRSMSGVHITNNIFYSCYSAGLDSTHAYDPQTYNANFFSPPALFTLDSINKDGTMTDIYGTTEENRTIDVNNNVYFWPQEIIDNFTTMNSDLATYGLVGGKILSPVFLAVRPGAEGVLNNAGIVFADNDSTDPGFDAALVTQAVTAMTDWVKDIWANGGSGLGDRPFVDLSTPTDPFNGVPADWQTTQGYPVPYNLKYSADLTDSEGLPVGDLTWWPELFITGVEKVNFSGSTYNILSQNYPNPFNSITNIKYNIPQSGFVTLKVYNMLGKEVATLVNQEQKAGEYNVDFDASSLAGGVYMYRIQSGNDTLTKKMMLLK